MVTACPPAPQVAAACARLAPLQVLVLERDLAQRASIVEILTGHGHSALGACSAEALGELPAGRHFDIALVDLELPGEDPLGLSARLRRTQPGLGIVTLSSRHSLDERIASYRSGADLCLAKPIEPAELCAALDALARRLQMREPRDADRLVLELANCLLHTPGGPLHLHRPEAEVLYALALAPGNFVESWQLLERLGKPLDLYGKAQLEVLISRLRSRLKALQPGSNPIRAERGKGYRLGLALQVQR